MKVSRRLLYFGSFVGLGLTAAAVLDRMGRPSIAGLLVVSVLVACLAGAPGLVHRRAWPLALVLLPLGAYLLARAQVSVPAGVHGLGAQAGFLIEQVRAGAHAYAADDYPVSTAAATHVGLVLSLVVYASVGLAAFLALSLRLAVPGIVVVLVLLGFGFTTDGTRSLWAPLLFLLLSGCLLVFSRSLQRESWRATDALTGAAGVVVAAFLALSLLGATQVAASQPLRDWHVWGIVVTENPYLGFNWMANYPSLLDKATNAPVMRVTSPVASYWRANALDSFDGTTWFSSPAHGGELTPKPVSGSFAYDVPAGSPRPPGKLVTESYSLSALTTDHLFTGGSARTLVIGSNVPVQVNPALALGVDRPLGPTLDYSLTAVVPQIRPRDLVGRGRGYPKDILVQYAALPFATPLDSTPPTPESVWRAAMSGSAARREWLGLYALDRRIVGPARDPYEVALRVEEYLRFNYGYSLTPPRTAYRSPYAAFLFKTRIGYCQHFAGAMAVLLRFNGIPARVAVGFRTGVRTGADTFLVTRNDAHAWVEVYFPGVGWAPFDPTPGTQLPGSGASSANAGFRDPFAADTGAGVAASLAPAQPALSKNGGAAGGAARAKAPAAHASPGGKAAARGAGSSAPRAGVPGWLLLGAVLVTLAVWPVGRALLRRRGLHGGSSDARLRASVALVYADLRDHGVHVPRSQTLDETARFLKARLDLDAGALAGRVQEVLFGGRAATDLDIIAVAALRRELRRRLRARTGRLRAVLALYGVPAAPA